MKITDNLVKRFGTDKMLHALVGAWCVSLAYPFGWLPMLVITVLMWIFSVIKEFVLDKSGDWYDILACVVGMLMSWAFYFLGMLFALLVLRISFV